MKKVLLTTTALVLTAGVASAEITFSGNGEAGFYRTGTSKAVAAKVGTQALTQSSAADNGTDLVLGAAATATAARGAWNYNSAGLLTYTAATDGTAEAATGNTTGANANTGTISTAADAVLLAERNLLLAQQTTVVDDEDEDQRATAIAVAEARLAIMKAALATQTGTAAVAAVKAGDMTAYSGYDFNVSASGAADNGMTFAMGFDMGAGHIADQDDDRAMDEQAGAIATSAMTIGYNGYTIEVGDDKIDDLYDDSQNGDVSLAGSFGDLTFKVVTDMQKDVAGSAAKYVAATGTAGNANYTRATFTEAVTAVYNPTSYSIGYAMGDMSFSLVGTEHDDRGNTAAEYSITTKVLPSLSATVSSDNVGTYKDIGKLAVTYTVSDAMSITASVKDDKDHALNTNTGGKQSQDMSVAYASGALSATIASDESSNWWVNAKYDLGGGATAFTTFDHTEFLVAGVNFKF
jgi:outer membrane protein OmpU